MIYFYMRFAVFSLYRPFIHIIVNYMKLKFSIFLQPKVDFHRLFRSIGTYIPNYSASVNPWIFIPRRKILESSSCSFVWKKLPTAITHRSVGMYSSLLVTAIQYFNYDKWMAGNMLRCSHNFFFFGTRTVHNRHCTFMIYARSTELY